MASAPMTAAAAATIKPWPAWSSRREERGYCDARREGDSQLQQVAGSRRLIAGTAETLRFEESGEDAAHAQPDGSGWGRRVGC
jgi:hypothetical protein